MRSLFSAWGVGRHDQGGPQSLDNPLQHALRQESLSPVAPVLFGGHLRPESILHFNVRQAQVRNGFLAVRRLNLQLCDEFLPLAARPVVRGGHEVS